MFSFVVEGVLIMVSCFFVFSLSHDGKLENSSMTTYLRVKINLQPSKLILVFVLDCPSI